MSFDSSRLSGPSSDGAVSDDDPYAHSAALAVSPRQTSLGQHPLRVHVISSKLDPTELEDLANLVKKHIAQRDGELGTQSLELVTVPDHADVVVTAIHTRPRLERHIRWEDAKSKAVVTPNWLRNSVNSGTIQPCSKYAAFSDLSDETESSCPKAGMGAPASSGPPIYYGQSPIFIDPEESVKHTDLVALNYLALVEELDIIHKARLYEGEERSMLSYARAIAAIKAYPHRLHDQTSSDEITTLPFLGPKFTSMVKEFAKTGKIAEAQKIIISTRFQTLSAFNAIHGIGPHTARHLYSLGLRTIEDVEKYYEIVPGMTLEGIQSHLQKSLENLKELNVEKSIQISLTLRHDFSQKIPRHEVKEINQVIMQELEVIEPGCKSIIVGGYRRGKQESSDVDIVISHDDLRRGAGTVRDLCKKLVQRLHQRGLVKHVLNMSGYHPPNVLRTHHWDSLEKALTVFVLPYHSARPCRRVDLIFVTPGIFWTAVVGWTGSTMFERDLRLWAKKQEKGLKFDSSGMFQNPTARLEIIPPENRERSV